MGERDAQDLAAGAARRARRHHGPLQRLLRRRPRRLRRPRPHRPREHLQHQRRRLPLPEHAAGLLAVQHLDPRPGLGACSASPSSWSSSTRCSDGELEALRRPDAGAGTLPRRPPAPPATSTSQYTPSRRHPLLGHRRARPRAPGRLSRPARRSVQRPRAGRQLGRRDRRAGAAPARPLPGQRTGETRSRRPLRRRPASPSPARCSPSRTCRPTRSTRGCSCTRSTTGRTAGTTSRRAGRVPCGESCMWGDYHARELALYIHRLARDEPYYAFYLR